MTLSTIRVGELEAFAASEAYLQMPVLPISPQRAVSQGRNPRAQPDDVALVLAWSGEKMTGYLGAVPDWFFFGQNPPQRIAWLSCLWISPEQRGKGLAKLLLNAMLDAWQGRVILTEFTPEVKNLYARSERLTESQPIPGFRGYLRPNFAQILPPKNPFLKKITPLLRAADVALSVPNSLRIGLLHGEKMPCQMRLLERADERSARFIAEHQDRELARRDHIVLNWMLENPWVVEAPAPDDFARRYHFTSSARQFQTRLLELHDEKQNLLGMVLLTLRDGHLRVPQAWFSDSQTAILAEAIFAQAIEMGAKMLTLYHPRLVQFCNENPTPFFWKKALHRSYFVGQGLAEILSCQPLFLQDGDGDAAFT